MLDSLFIKNFRNLENIKIASLGNINLITGKNNTGKSSILEALAIYASRGDFSLVYQLLHQRGEDYSLNSYNNKDIKEYVENNIRSLSAMFNGRKVSFLNEGIQIGLLSEDLSFSKKNINLRFVKYIDEVQKSDQGEIFRRRLAIAGNNNTETNFNIGFEIKSGDEVILIPLDKNKPYRLGYGDVGNGEKYQFIRTANIDKDINGKLFDNIALTDKEQFVIEALKIIEPTTERIAFVGENPRERIAVIKLSNATEVLPLRSMGDGINRVLTIILALVNSDNGYLLLDEFENGLHYSVQKSLWQIIFKLSKSLNIQVFATTHSNDCILGFERALNDDANQQVSGKLIRLDNINGIIKQVEFSQKEIMIANNQDIEIR
ncbi:MAG: hypothetical protein H6Q14_2927 [Bacteroidetes bacterium]|nr:hypothetical protein [Bacteroidota bacterium]